MSDPKTSTSQITPAQDWLRLIQLPSLVLVVEPGLPTERLWETTLASIRLGKDADNDLVLADTAVSRFHAKLTRTTEGLRVTDLGSKNGTFINDIRCLDGFLPADSLLRLGSTVVRVVPGQRDLAISGSPQRQHPAIIGESPALKSALATLEAVAAEQVTVCIEGESGTGKEMVARLLHDLSGRKGPYITFDCSSTSKDLIRSELFGHKAGSFTGAETARPGAFRSAHRGTLFLDELGELPLELQPMLLRVLEQREVQPLGEDRAVPVDVRVVTATNRDLAREVASGAFRRDLYHRVTMIPVKLPPLRDRPEDIPFLVDHFIRTLSLGCSFEPGAIAALQAHDWPGNVRELRNVIHRAGLLHRSGTLTAKQLGMAAPPASSSPTGPGSAEPAELSGMTLEEVEREVILRTYDRCDRNQVQTARALDISLGKLRRKLAEYSGDR